MDEPPPTNLSAASAFVRDRATWLAYLSLGCFAFLEAGLGPLMPFLRADLGFGYGLASLHFSAFAVGLVLVGVTGEAVARRWGRRAAFWGGVGGMMGGAALLVLAPSPAVSILAVLAMGAFGGLLALTIQANLAERHGPARAVAIVEANLAASASAALSTVAIGGLEGIGASWRLGVLAAVAGFGLLVAGYHTVPIPRAIPPGAARLGARGRLPRAFWVFAVVIFLGVAVEWCLAYWGADFLQQRAGLDGSTSATALGVFFLAMLLGRAFGSRLARRLAAERFLLAALILATAGFPLAWLPTWAPLNLLGLFLTGLGIANIYPLAFTAALAAVPGRADLATARLVMLGGAAILVLPLTLGLLAGAIGIETAFGIGLPLLLAALALASSALGTPTEH